MDSTSSEKTPLKRYAQAMREHWKLWLFPTVCCTALAIVYAYVVPASWEATQALHIRDESIGKSTVPGRFDSYEAMKTAQETIHAVAKNRHVLRKVLEDVGPPKGHPKKWPTNEDVDDLMSAVSLTAPNGAIFGQTEVIHLNVKASSPARAIQMTETLVAEMENRLRLIREERATSLESEMIQAVDVAEADLQTSATKLKEVENQLGPDLAELRNLNQLTASNDGTLQQSLGQTRQQISANQQKQASIKTRQEYLSSIHEDPNAIETVPASVLAAHPSLGRLKQGLVDARLRFAQTFAAYDPSHPRSGRAELEASKIREQLRREVGVAMQESEFDLQEAQKEEAKLRLLETAMSNRIQRLSEGRVEYNRLVDEVDQRKKDLAAVSTQLGEIRASMRAAANSSVIGHIDSPVVGTRPVGPSKKMLAISGMLCGFAIGFGLVVLAMPAEPLPNPPNQAGANPIYVQAMPTDASSVNQVVASAELKRDAHVVPTAEQGDAHRQASRQSPEEPAAEPSRPSRQQETYPSIREHEPVEVASVPDLTNVAADKPSETSVAFASEDEAVESHPAIAAGESGVAVTTETTTSNELQVDSNVDIPGVVRHPKPEHLVKEEFERQKLQALKTAKPFIPSQENAPSAPVAPTRRNKDSAAAMTDAASAGEVARAMVEKMTSTSSQVETPSATQKPAAGLPSAFAFASEAVSQEPIAEASLDKSSVNASAPNVESDELKLSVTPAAPDPETIRKIDELKKQWQGGQQVSRQELAKELAQTEDQNSPTQYMGREPADGGSVPRRSFSTPSEAEKSDDDSLLNELQRLREEMRSSE